MASGATPFDLTERLNQDYLNIWGKYATLYFYLPESNITRMPVTTAWRGQFSPSFGELNPRHNKWGRGYYSKPRGAGPKGQWRSTVYPAPYWARQAQQTWRQPGVSPHLPGALDSLQARAALEDPATMGDVMLLEERGFHVMSRFEPTYDEGYVRMLAGRYALRHAPWSFPINPVRALTRWTGADTSGFSASLGAVLGWGGRIPSQV